VSTLGPPSHHVTGWATVAGSRAVDESLRRGSAGTPEHHPVFYEGDRYESATSLGGLAGGYGKGDDDYDRGKGVSSMRHSSSYGSIGESAADRSRHGTTSGFAGFEDVAGADGEFKLMAVALLFLSPPHCEGAKPPKPSLAAASPFRIRSCLFCPLGSPYSYKSWRASSTMCVIVCTGGGMPPAPTWRVPAGARGFFLGVRLVV
jgi:hypothetical protein